MVRLKQRLVKDTNLQKEHNADEQGVASKGLLLGLLQGFDRLLTVKVGGLGAVGSMVMRWLSSAFCTASKQGMTFSGPSMDKPAAFCKEEVRHYDEQLDVHALGLATYC